MCLLSPVWTGSLSNRWEYSYKNLTLISIIGLLQGDSMEEEGGGGVWQHPDGAGDDQDGPALQGHHRRLRGGEAVAKPGRQAVEDLSEGKPECELRL